MISAARAACARRFCQPHVDGAVAPRSAPARAIPRLRTRRANAHAFAARDAPRGPRGSTIPHHPAPDALPASPGIHAASGSQDRRFRFPWGSLAAPGSMAGCRSRAQRAPRGKGPPARSRYNSKGPTVERSRARRREREAQDRCRPRVRCHAVPALRRAHRALPISTLPRATQAAGSGVVATRRRTRGEARTRRNADKCYASSGIRCLPCAIIRAITPSKDRSEVTDAVPATEASMRLLIRALAHGSSIFIDLNQSVKVRAVFPVLAGKM